MKLSSAISIALIAASSLAAPIASTPARRPVHNLIVVNPHITSPEGSEHWPQGSRQLITWDTDKIPREHALATGLVLLGYSTLDDESENLDVENPLASGFKLTEGRVEVTIPPVETGDNYFIVLMGDSGNASPKFTIEEA